ncbi:MAG: trypsin-like serine protease, partial [Myxococcota bacterium]|nr:trypsin-like serine protease [Myxococcota bacterium]
MRTDAGRSRGATWAPAACAALIAACAGSDAGDRAGATGLGIVGGRVSEDDRQVFVLEATGGVPMSSMCSATLIGARTLLTAAHCVSSYTGGPVSIRATNAVSLASAGPSDFIRAAATRRHPAWRLLFPYDYDVAVVLLETAPPLAPKPWNTADLAGSEGLPIRSVGYGMTAPADPPSAGTRHTVDLAFREISPRQYALGDLSGRGVCQGDSGGPSFHTFPDGIERVVGVHSSGNPDTCVDGVDMRVDAYAALIVGWLAELEGLGCDADGVCNPSCDPEDPDCAPPDLCGSDGECSSDPCDPPDPDCEDAVVPDPDAGDDAPLDGSSDTDADSPEAVDDADAEGEAVADARDVPRVPGAGDDDGGCGCSISPGEPAGWAILA